MKKNCIYFHAFIKKEKVISFVSLFRSIDDNIAFDRTEDRYSDIFEFFVPPHTVARFYEIMSLLLEQEYIMWFKTIPIDESKILQRIHI